MVLKQKTVLRCFCFLTANDVIFFGHGATVSSVFAIQSEDKPCCCCSATVAVQAIFLPQLFVLFCARTAQRQCCLGSQAASRCLAGINAAKAGDVCQENASDKCGIDSLKVSTCDQTLCRKGQTQFMALHHHIWP